MENDMCTKTKGEQTGRKQADDDRSKNEGRINGKFQNEVNKDKIAISFK